MKKTYSTIKELHIEAQCPYCKRSQIKVINYQNTSIVGDYESGHHIEISQKSFYCTYCAERFIMELI